MNSEKLCIAIMDQPDHRYRPSAQSYTPAEGLRAIRPRAEPREYPHAARLAVASVDGTQSATGADGELGSIPWPVPVQLAVSSRSAADPRSAQMRNRFPNQTARRATGTHQHPDSSLQCHCPRNLGIAQYRVTHPTVRNQVRPHQTGSGFEVGFGRWPGPSA